MGRCGLAEGVDAGPTLCGTTGVAGTTGNVGSEVGRGIDSGAAVAAAAIAPSAVFGALGDERGTGAAGGTRFAGDGADLAEGARADALGLTAVELLLLMRRAGAALIAGGFCGETALADDCDDCFDSGARAFFFLFTGGVCLGAFMLADAASLPMLLALRFTAFRRSDIL